MNNPQIKSQFFPKMPEEVFSQWIAGLIDYHGWPFESLDDLVSGTKWNGVFLSIVLREWHGFDWTLKSVNSERFMDMLNSFSFDTKRRIDGIIGHCVHGIQTEYANIHDTKNRFLACADFIQTNRALPLPVVGVLTGNGCDLVDGYHRMAALFSGGRQKICLTASIWLAYKPLSKTVS